MVHFTRLCTGLTTIQIELERNNSTFESHGCVKRILGTKFSYQLLVELVHSFLFSRITSMYSTSVYICFSIRSPLSNKS